jgi:iron complex outermembrane receptor protein
LSFGGGIRFVGSERTSYDGSTENIPAYTLVDLSATYAIQKWSVQLNLHNLLNERYYINNYQTLFYGNVPGDPLNASITIRRDF